MDEITLVRQFRADVPEPDPSALHEIRNDLMAALPAAGSERPGRTGARTGRMRLLTARRVGGRTSRTAQMPALAFFHRRRTVIRLAMVAGVVAALVLSTIVIDSLSTSDGRPVVGHEAAAGKLRQAAAEAIRVSDPPLKPGQFLYLRTVAVNGTNDVADCGRLFYLRKSVQETWVPKDWGDQWMLRGTQDMDRQFVRPGDAAKLEKLEKCAGLAVSPTVEVRKARAGFFYPEGTYYGDEPRDADGAVVYDWSPAEIAQRLAHGTWQTPTPQFMAGLPRDPQHLLDRIHHDSKGMGAGADDEAFVFIRDILRSGVVPADLRAALFEAAALIPAVYLVSDSVNLEGRHGVAVTLSSSGETRVELILDPASGTVIGEREVVIGHYVDDVPRGTTISYSAVTRQVVDAMGETPKK